ncbi:MAG TPA: YicC/YloC family endoribonuclease, partial [Opitutales bacterium]|nr:YicC/YloC family endoribonuclease [Opitutales bacterium]
MIKSMTGYGRAVGTGADEQIVVEISSVNRKTLDIAISLPREWQSLEPEIAAAVREQVTRGR